MVFLNFIKFFPCVKEIYYFIKLSSFLYFVCIKFFIYICKPNGRAKVGVAVMTCARRDVAVGDGGVRALEGSLWGNWGYKVCSDCDVGGLAGSELGAWV